MKIIVISVLNESNEAAQNFTAAAWIITLIDIEKMCLSEKVAI
jgi:hypothetical protein